MTTTPTPTLQTRDEIRPYVEDLKAELADVRRQQAEAPWPARNASQRHQLDQLTGRIGGLLYAIKALEDHSLGSVSYWGVK